MTSGPVGAVVAAWLAVALVGSYELLMMVIRNSQAAPDAPSDSVTMPEPLQEQAAEVFADHLAADRVPVGGTLRCRFRHVSGIPRAQSVEDLTALLTSAGER